MPEAYIIDGCRTPRGIGKIGKGALAGMHPQHLTVTVLKAIVTLSRSCRRRQFSMPLASACWIAKSFRTPTQPWRGLPPCNRPLIDLRTLRLTRRGRAIAV